MTQQQTGSRIRARYTAGLPLFWEIETQAGAILREPPEHVSITEPGTNVRALYLVDGTGHRIIAVPMAEGGATYLPIWYRWHSQAPGEAESTADAVVFGRLRPVARAAHRGDDGTLYADVQYDGLLLCAERGRVMDCPPHRIDYTRLSMQVDR